MSTFEASGFPPLPPKPDVVAIIPARGGSKRIPGKNTLPLQGLPTLAYSVIHARDSAAVAAVYVSTDDDRIAEIATEHGAEVIWRPADLAGDTATSESAISHALDELQKSGRAGPDIVVMLQCTSPVRRPNDIDEAIAGFVAAGADSMLSACINSRFIWGMRDGQPYSINYDFHNRRREQDFEVQYRENGSMYLFKPSVLRQTNNRLGGRIAVHVMDYLSSFQIDDPEHVELIDWILQRPEYAVRPLAAAQRG